MNPESQPQDNNTNGANAPQVYDLGRDFTAFNREIENVQQDIKSRFEDTINKRLRGKKIVARASKGYKQFQKFYTIDVLSVSIENRYGNFVVVAKGKDNKEYYLNTLYKIKVYEPGVPVEQPAQPEDNQEKQPETPQKPETSPAPKPAASAPAKPAPRAPAPASREPGPPPNPAASKQLREDFIKDYGKELSYMFAISENSFRSALSYANNIDRDNSVYSIHLRAEDSPALLSGYINESLDSINRKNYTHDLKLENFDVVGSYYRITIGKTRR